MPLPAPLSRRNPSVHKNSFGHVLVLAGSRNMLGAAALTGLAAMRSGAGLVTIGIPKSLNSVLQKKISPVIMTLPLTETPEQTLSLKAYSQLKNNFSRYQAIALGPGLSQNDSTQKLIRKILERMTLPIVLDADGLNAFHYPLSTIHYPLILTPHPGEMAKLTGKTKAWIESNRKKAASEFARKNNVVLLLKGHRTVVASPDGKIYINPTGNAGMATAGSGDILTGMIAAFLGQGLSGFESAKWGAYLHGLAGDLAAKDKSRCAMIATDILDFIAPAIKRVKRQISLECEA